jgi:hypothetical protein
MSEPAKYSISRAIADVIEAGVPRNKAESEFHFEAVRSSEKSGLSKMLGWPGRGFIATLRGLSTRQATSGPWTQEKAVAEGLGVIGWSARRAGRGDHLGAVAG